MNLAVRQKYGARGFSLFELIITLGVLTIMILAAVPLLQNSIRREKEQKLRETLREVRAAIDEFKRDTVGSCPLGNLADRTIPGGLGGQPPSFDPRSRVMVDDCKIFTTDNIDRYPPTLDDLVNGVRVKSRMPSSMNFTKKPFDDGNATDIDDSKEVIKKYLRQLPVDPMTGESDWEIRSSYQDKDATDWDKINVFDIRSSSDADAMNGEKYSDW